MSLYAVCPFLPSARRRAERLGISIDSLSETVVDDAVNRLRFILSRRFDLPVLGEKEEIMQYVVFRIILSVLDNPYYYDLLGRFYAERVKHSNYVYDVLSEAGVGPEVELPQYMRFKHIYPETKIYHLELRNGTVIIPENILPLVAANVAYSYAVASLPLDVSRVPKWIRERATSAIPVRTSKPSSGKGYAYIEAVLSASGLPDGRKRLLFYWIVPYLLNVKGMHPDEVFSTVKEWLGRQGGSEKVLDSWIRAQINNAGRKKIRPWSLKKVESVDPSLISLLRELGVLQ